MNTKPTPSASSPSTTCPLLAYYQEKRARYRVYIRSLIAEFNQYQYLKYCRFVPRLVRTSWSRIDPGCPDITYESRRDNFPFSGVEWLEIESRYNDPEHPPSRRGTVVSRMSTDEPLSRITYFVQDGLGRMEGEEVRDMMRDINEAVNRYRELDDHLLALLEVADVFCDEDDEDAPILPAGQLPFPYAGLPDLTDLYRKMGKLEE